MVYGLKHKAELYLHSLLSIYSIPCSVLLFVQALKGYEMGNDKDFSNKLAVRAFAGEKAYGNIANETQTKFW